MRILLGIYKILKKINLLASATGYIGKNLKNALNVENHIVDTISRDPKKATYTWVF